MKILIITQSIDENNPVLGFFTNWVTELSKKFEKVTVICLEKGEHNLPENVRVYSLGKEQFENSNIENSLKIKNSKLKIFRLLKYISNFYKYIWRERKNYDSVFVHMNEEYVLLGGLFWKLFSKKIVLWRNFKTGSWMTSLVCRLSDKVCYTSKDSFTSKYRNSVKMPLGINTEVFLDLNIERDKNSILFLGRISEIKRPDVLIEALKILKDKKISFSCDFYGDPDLKEFDYYKDLRKKVLDYGLSDVVSFLKSIPNHKTPSIYNKYELYINLTPSGSFDKTIGEAIICGCMVLCVNNELDGVLPKEMILNKVEPKEAEDVIVWAMSLSDEKKKEIIKMSKEYFYKNHSLDKLVDEINKIFYEIRQKN